MWTMKKSYLLLSAVAMLCITCSNIPEGEAQKNPSGTLPTVGKTLPLWSEGNLDIHFINTARGECCFYILPDGTTLLVDAGEIASFGQSVVYGLGSGIGWWIAIVMMAAIRERCTYSNIPAALKGPGIAFIITGLLGIAFMIFSGIQL